VTQTEAHRDVHSLDVSVVDDPHHLFDPERLDPGLASYLIAEDDELWDPSERFVYSVFRVSGFCGESPREWVEETQPWRPGSRLHVIADEEMHINGVARTIIGHYDDLPVSQFRPTIPMPDRPLCEIGSLAVRPSHRGLGVANELHRAAFQYGIREDVAGFCFLIDEWMFDFFRTYYGLPVRAIAPPREFMGGVVVATAMFLPEMMEQLVRVRPKVYRWSIEGLEPEVLAARNLPILLT
jgi:GNAT superfamily N-acetyltransferase